MPEIDREFLRKLADWSSNGIPVSSLYLDVDGRRYPRRQDYMVRAEQLCHELQRSSKDRTLNRDATTSVAQDAARMLEYLQSLDRGSTRGVALFSASKASLWEPVVVPRPLKDRATLAPHPYVIPLEALVETYECFCTALVDRAKARIFLARMGQIQERTDVFDDVPGRHEQGGWSQSRYQRHIGDHETHHLKHVADVLLRFYKLKKFDHLILAAPDELIPEFERSLHDYLRRRIAARVTLPMTASAAEVLQKSLAVEEEIEKARERSIVERVTAETSAGRNGVAGLGPVLHALNDGRVDTLVVPFGLSMPGTRCQECGRLATSGSVCRTCGGRLEPVPDVVEGAVANAIRQSSRVEILSLLEPEETAQEVAALLRF
ncbi:MAG TPA: Vms1/Ankzf1 family peptidyl-tRNA hydrolase [Actinomycetota bacterium]|jgi:peptide chain release factor subunit 1